MRTTVIVAILALSACSNQPATIDDYEANLRQTLRNVPNAKSDAYALMKDGLAGPSWLATIHGYPDNQNVCEELIKPYNEDSSLSTLPGDYYCERV